MFNKNVLNCIHHFQSRWRKVSIAQNTSSLEEPAQMNGSQSHQEHTSLFCIQPALALYTSRWIQLLIECSLSLSQTSLFCIQPPLALYTSRWIQLLIECSLSLQTLQQQQLPSHPSLPNSHLQRDISASLSDWLRSLSAIKSGEQSVTPEISDRANKRMWHRQASDCRGKQPAPNTETTPQPQTNANDSELKQRSTRQMKTLI